MAVIKQGILGGLSGRIGNVVGSSWKGKAVLKSRPLSVANPKSVGQVAQRGAMSQIVIVARLLLATIVQPLWNPFSQGMSGYNAFVKENIKTFTAAGFTTFADFFSQRGSLMGFDTLSISADSGASTITTDWVNNAGIADALASDLTNIVVYNATQNYWVVSANGAERGSEQHVVSDTVMQSSDVLHIYSGYSRTNFSKVSDSEYKTVTVS